VSTLCISTASEANVPLITGEDALANLSIEKAEGTGIITGHVRIRSKTQGIALSLGDKITLGESISSALLSVQPRLTRISAQKDVVKAP
jgi:hypothetical protein